MLKTSKLALAFGALLILTSGLAGCFTDEDRTYQGPLQVEFKPLLRTVASGSGLQQMNVQLIGPHQSTPLNLRVVAAEGSTAQPGVHYNLVDGGQFAIPAQSSFGTASVNVLPAATGGLLILELQSAEGDRVIPAENLKQFRLTIQAPPPPPPPAP